MRVTALQSRRSGIGWLYGFTLISTNPTETLSCDDVYPRFHFYRKHWLEFGGALVPDPPIAKSGLSEPRIALPRCSPHTRQFQRTRRLSSGKRCMTNPKAAFRAERPFFVVFICGLNWQLATQASAAMPALLPI